MNNELQSQLANILAAIQSTAAATSDFAMAQLPDIAQQYVMYGRVKSLWLTLTLLIAAIVMFWLSRWAYKNPWNGSKFSWDREQKRSESNQAVIAISASVGGLLVLVNILQFNWMVWVAPKVWLLHVLAQMVGSAK